MQEKGLFEYWKECYTLKFKDFEGRARRKEYWGLFLFNVIFGGIIGFVFGFIAGLLNVPFISTLGTILVCVVTIVPSLAAGVRRLHDIGKEWYYILLCLVPVVGALVLLYFLVQDSQPGENAYGPNPKGL